MSLPATLWARIRALPKMRRFTVFLAMAAVVGAIGSAVTWLAVLRAPEGPPVKLAVIAPLSGPDAAVGQALLAGARHWVAGNAEGRSGGRRVELAVFDEATTPDALRRAAADPAVLGVIGPLAPAPAEAARLGLPQLMLSGPAAGDAAWSFPLAPDLAFEARFLANYVRNVVGERLVSILLPEGPDHAALADAFDQTLQRFGTRVVYRWAIPDGAGRPAALQAAVREIADRQIAGAILVLGDASFGAAAVATLGAAEVGNRIVGLRPMATRAFEQALRGAWRASGSVGAALNGTLVTTPVLFDMAGARAQAFQAGFRAAEGHAPDWVAVLGHDAAAAFGQALAGQAQPARAGLRAALLRLRTAEAAIPGLAGPIFFDERGSGALATLVGSYDGTALVAAPTQLTPIREEGVSNYLDQLAAGRILYVNDRFMYRTNVVFSGIRLGKVTALHPASNVAELEFVLWFRWRGSLAPQDVVFENAVTPIELGEPIRAADDGDLHYRAWQVRGRFYLDFSDIARPFGRKLVNVTFRHRTLARNNLTFVADVVGMDLAGQSAAAPMQQGWLGRLTGAPAETRSTLARQLTEQKVLAGVPGWLVEQALLSQELARSGTDGDPSYVGFGKPAPLFSRLALDLVLKPDAIDIRALVPKDWLIYLAIFALSGAALAHLLDRRDRGQFWRMQTLVLRLATWPVLLATCSALLLDHAVLHASMAVVQAVDFLARAAWWLVPARLVSLSVERFVWAPLEANTARRVPSVFRIIVSLVIYALAGLGIVAFVLDRTITSLLATSGLLTLIVGLAVQSNLKDIFSGVMLNLERPFSLGDWVRINRTIGQVHDISWRTTRLRTYKGQIISFANGRVVESEIENLTRAGYYDASIYVYMDPRCPPEAAMAAIRHGVEAAQNGSFVFEKLRLSRVENQNGSWVARYKAELKIQDFAARNGVQGMVWPEVWKAIDEAGLTWALVPAQDAEGNAGRASAQQPVPA